MLQKSFFFDYIGFQKEIAPLIAEIEQGDYTSLYAKANKVINEVKPQDWVLEDQGTMLERFEYEDIGTSLHVQIGYLLLVILSTYLSPAPILYSGLLKSALERSGWNKLDSELLFTGFPTSRLINEEFRVQKGKLSIVSEPYWELIIPTQSYENGWIPVDQVQRLKIKLINSTQQIESFDITELKAPFIYPPESPEKTFIRLQSAFHTTLETLEKAEQMQLGLYMVIS